MMNTLTLHLPDYLYRSLQTQAQKAGVTMEDLIVFSLTRQTSDEYRVEATTEAQQREQVAQHAALLQSLGRASKEEAQRILQMREQVKPEVDLDAVAAARLRAHLEKG
jgi:hypothetical protein